MQTLLVSQIEKKIRSITCHQTLLNQLKPHLSTPSVYLRHTKISARSTSKVKVAFHRLTSVPFADASSSNEAVHLQQRLRSLSTELVTLRNRLHVQGAPAAPLKGSALPVPRPGSQPVVPPRSVPAAPAPVVAVPECRPLAPTAGADLEDLIHLQGPLTEDAVMKCLQARFAASNFYVSIGH